MLENNKQLVRRYYETVMGDCSELEQIVASDFVDHHFPSDVPPGPKGVHEFFAKIAAGIFSDMRIRIDRLLADGDWVDCHFALLALHSGDFGGVAPKGNSICCPAISTFRVEGGKLAEAWEIFDSGDLVRQMQA